MGTILDFPPFPVIHTLYGLLKRIEEGDKLTISETLAPVSYIRDKIARSLLPRFRLISGCSNKSWIPSIVRYLTKLVLVLLFSIVITWLYADILSGFLYCTYFTNERIAARRRFLVDAVHFRSVSSQSRNDMTLSFVIIDIVICSAFIPNSFI